MAINSLSSILSRTRVSGMASGLDTDSLVSDLMKVEQLKLDKIQRNKTLAEWKNDSIRNINNSIRALRDKFMSVRSSDNMYTESAYKIFNVSYDDKKSVEIKAGTNAAISSHTIEITEIAKAAAVKSEGGISSQEKSLSTSQTLEELSLSKPMTFDGDGKISFKINSVDFEFDKSVTLQTVINTVNKSSANVTMSYSSLADGFTITSKDTGSASAVNIENIGGNAFGSDSALGISEQIKTGSDAILNIDGYDLVRSSNAFTIDGISYTLKDKTTSAVNFSISQDIDAAVDKITAFVNSYNELVSSLDNTIREEKYYSYTPLTSAEREELETQDIENWEKKAKSGILRNDMNITRLISEMRHAIFDQVEGTGLSLNDIGISTGTYQYGKSFQLVIDESKLREQLASSPDDVLRVFTDTSYAENTADKYNQSGFLARMAASFTTYTNNVDLPKLSEEIRNYENEISEFELKMYEKSEKYYTQFAAMESALSRMYSQSEWLSQQFS